MQENRSNAKKRIIRYKSGFHSSLCDMFRDAAHRSTDCCSMACCGVLESDRTYFLVTSGELPPSWRFRIFLNFMVPAMIFVGGHLLADASNNIPGAPLPDSRLLVMVTNVLTLSIVVVLLGRGAAYRYDLRQRVLARMRQEEQGEITTLLDESRNMLPQGRSNDYHDERVHATCCFVTKDLVVTHEHGDASASPEFDSDNNNDAYQDNQNRGDLCGWIFQFFSSLCCGWCGCWCQCCGMCATAQEGRELKRLFPKRERMRDYVTFESFMEYYPSIANLRIQGENSFWKHMQTLSQLSAQSVSVMLSILLAMLLLALLRVHATFTVENLLVVLATLFQSFLLLYCVHWLYCRHDISMDAVIKFFCSGFILCPPVTMVYEILVSTFLGFVTSTIMGFNVALEGAKANIDFTDKNAYRDFVRQYAKDHLWLFAIFTALDTFLVAALVEELVKYHGYKMVSHPDFYTKRELIAMSPSSVGALEGGITNLMLQSIQQEPHKTYQSRASAITVAMVAVALGFACCENLIYVFLYTPPTIATEVSTLVLRSLFPLHPLVAAIQSIGVCKRDVEGIRSFELGRILAVPLLIHGFFDFALAFWGLLVGVRHMDDVVAPTPAPGGAGDDVGDLFSEQLVPLLVSIAIMLSSLFYYIATSRAQTRRLMELDRVYTAQKDEGDANSGSGGSSTTPLATAVPIS